MFNSFISVWFSVILFVSASLQINKGLMSNEHSSSLSKEQVFTQLINKKINQLVPIFESNNFIMKFDNSFSLSSFSSMSDSQREELTIKLDHSIASSSVINQKLDELHQFARQHDYGLIEKKQILD
jgi:hypothetical protein